MAEYIDREATLNAIENAFDRETILNRFVRKIAIIAVKKMPAADVRQVVYCRNCVFSEESLVNGCVYCNQIERVTLEEGWCSWGEPREEG